MIYISGPMSGLPENNYPKFNRIAKYLRNKGHKVFNPAEVKIVQEGLSEKDLYEAYMDADLKGLKLCNIIFLLKNWNKSPGAKRELELAIQLKLEIITESEGFL